MNAELANYLRRCADPRFALRAAMRFGGRLRSAVALRAQPGRVTIAYPESVCRARAVLLANSPDMETIAAARTFSATRLTLAVGSAAIQTALDWRQPFADPEVGSSLHRWSWLLFGVTEDTSPITREEGLALMRSWLAECGDDLGCMGGPYTTSERVSNGLLFLTRHGGADVPSDLAAAFRRMGRAVATHLEFHPDGMTGNHAFNNARALLLAGLLAELPGARDLAYAIAAEMLPILVTDDGFMREGSSHYQFVFTRWVLEMQWAARRAADTAFESLLAPYAASLVARCWFFLVSSPSGQWNIPLVGDVSPDCPVAWLLDLPWSPLAMEAFAPLALPPAPTQRGWGTLFGERVSGSEPIHGAAECYPRSGWCRAYVQPWTLFVRARSSDGELRSGHEHCDLGSYVLFRDGEPLVVDCGRHDYTCSPLSLYGKGAVAHNAPIVDGLAPMANGPTWLAPGYTGVEVLLSLSDTGVTALVTVSHNGFSRLGGSAVRHRRELHLGPTGLRTEDHFAGGGERQIALHLHFGPDVRDADGAERWALGTASGTVRFDDHLIVTPVAGSIESPVGCLYFPSYGQHQTISTLEASGRVAFPVTLVHAILDEQT